MTDTLETIDTTNEQERTEYRDHCAEMARRADYKLLSRAEANTKIRKSRRIDFRIVSLSLAHHRTSGINVCPQASPACSAACVGGDNVGLAQVWPEIMAGRVRKTQMMAKDLGQFVRQLIGEIEQQRRTAERLGAQLCCRLNQFSDLPWEAKAYGSIPQLFPEVIFYDYTKIHSRVRTAPENYHLCGSWSELTRHQAACAELLAEGYNVAIAFSVDGAYAGNRAGGQSLPKRWRVAGHWYECYSGDESDLRFLDPGETRSGRGRICALRLKAGNNVTRGLAIERGFSVHRGEA